MTTTNNEQTIHLDDNVPHSTDPVNLQLSTCQLQNIDEKLKTQENQLMNKITELKNEIKDQFETQKKQLKKEIEALNEKVSKLETITNGLQRRKVAKLILEILYNKYYSILEEETEVIKEITYNSLNKLRFTKQPPNTSITKEDCNFFLYQLENDIKDGNTICRYNKEEKTMNLEETTYNLQLNLEKQKNVLQHFWIDCNINVISLKNIDKTLPKLVELVKKKKYQKEISKKKRSKSRKKSPSPSLSPSQSRSRNRSRSRSKSHQYNKRKTYSKGTHNIKHYHKDQINNYS